MPKNNQSSKNSGRGSDAKKKGISPSNQHTTTTKSSDRGYSKPTSIQSARKEIGSYYNQVNDELQKILDSQDRSTPIDIYEIISKLYTSMLLQSSKAI